MKKFIKKIFKKEDPEEYLSNKRNDNTLAETKEEYTFSKEASLEAEESVLRNVPQLQILIEKKVTGTHTIGKDPIVIGRDPSVANIILSELIVSKSHCTIYKKENHFFIKDNNSTNGLYYKDEKISEKKLFPDDIISLGKKGAVSLLFLLPKNT